MKLSSQIPIQRPPRRAKPTFLTLPSEIRNIIYGYLFANLKVTVRYVEKDGWWGGYSSQYCGLEPLDSFHVTNVPRVYAILRVCKKISYEASAVAASLPISYAFPHAGRYDLHGLPGTLLEQVTSVSITSRGIPCPQDLACELRPYRSQYDERIYGFRNLREVMIHSYTSFPIKIANPDYDLRNLCASGLDTDLGGSLLSRFRCTRDVVWRGIELKRIKEGLGSFTLKIRCSLYQPETSDEDLDQPSNYDSQNDERVWFCQVSGFLLWNKQDMKLTDLRQHKTIKKKEKDLFKGVKENDEDDEFYISGYSDFTWDKFHRRGRLQKWLDWQHQW